ncbi:MAG: uroporphyrinogen decarboxylase family protein [Bacillota bacterium]
MKIIKKVTAQMHEHVLKIKDIEGKKLYTNSKILVEGIVDIFNKYGFSEPGLGYDVYNIEAEAAGQEVIFFKDSSPQTSQKKFLINSTDDFDKLKNINIGIGGRMNFVINALKEFKRVTSKTPPLQFCAPFSLAVALYGYERLVTDMYTKPEVVHILMNIITEDILTPWIEYQKEIVPDWKVALGADALASPPNLTLDLLEEFVLPYVIKLKDNCGDNVGVVNWWGESHIKDLDRFLDLKMKASPNNKILRVQDPDLEKIDLTKITDFVLKNDMDLTFGIGAKLLSGGKVEKIKERAIKYTRKGIRVKNFTLYLCNISKDTPEDNIFSAVNTAREVMKI